MDRNKLIQVIGNFSSCDFSNTMDIEEIVSYEERTEELKSGLSDDDCRVVFKDWGNNEVKGILVGYEEDHGRLYFKALVDGEIIRKGIDLLELEYLEKLHGYLEMFSN